jgi:hypothetical protein
MFGAPLSEQNVQPAGTPQPGQMPQQQGQEPYGFDRALSDVIDFLGMGGTEQAERNQLEDERDNPFKYDDSQPERGNPYQPTHSGNVLDRQNVSPDLDEAVRRYGSAAIGDAEPSAKRAAARISLMPHGVVPFVSAAYDIATGQNNPRNLSLGDLYNKRQTEANMLVQDQKPAAQMVDDYLPYIAGPAIGAFAPASKGGQLARIVGTGLRGAAAGGIVGGVQGYFDPEFDSRELSDPDRISQGLKRGGLGAVMAGTLAAGTHAGGELIKDGYSQMRGPQNPQSVTEKVPLASKPMLRGQAQSEQGQRAFEDQLAYRLGLSPDEMRPKVSAARSEPAPAPRQAPSEPATAPQATEQPKGLNEAVKPAQATTTPKQAPSEPPKAATQPKPTPKPKAEEVTQSDVAEAKAKATPKQAEEAPQFKKTKSPITQSQFRRFNESRKGKEAWAEINADRKLAQIKGQTDIVKADANPPTAREMLLNSGKVPAKVTPDTPPNEGNVSFSKGEAKGSYTPTEKRGLMQIADELSAQSGRSPGKWNAADKEEFIKGAARHTTMRPSQIKGLLTSYGENATRASPGMSNKRIAEIVEAERTAERLKTKK